MLMYRICVILQVYLLSPYLRAENGILIHEAYCFIILALGVIIQFMRFTCGFVITPQMLESLFPILWFNWKGCMVAITNMTGLTAPVFCSYILFTTIVAITYLFICWNWFHAHIFSRLFCRSEEIFGFYFLVPGFTIFNHIRSFYYYFCKKFLTYVWVTNRLRLFRTYDLFQSSNYVSFTNSKFWLFFKNFFK